MNSKEHEFLLGVSIGLILAILFSVKAMAANLTSEETEMIAKIVELESGNQCLQGRRCVAAVILNRCDKEQFPDSVSEVLSAPGQFVTYKHIDDATPTWQSELAVKMEVESRSDREIVFFRPGSYGTGKAAYKIQDHYFSTLNDDKK